MARRFTAATALLLLTACSRAEPPPALDVAGLPAIRLTLQTIEVENRAPVPAAQGFIARRRSAELAAAAVGYLRSQVTAAGGTEFGRATVEEASLIEQATEGGGGLLGTGPGREMVGALALRVAVVDGFGIETGFAQARVQITRSLPSRASVETEDRLTRQLTNDLVAAAGRDLDRSVWQNLAAYRAP